MNLKETESRVWTAFPLAKDRDKFWILVNRTNEISGSVKERAILDQLNDCYLLKQNYVQHLTT